MSQILCGFMRWYDLKSDDGILEDFEGREFYFNSWSFPKTYYLVTGICKKSKRKKTIKTRKLPGLFLDHKHIHDPLCGELKNGMPFYFTQAKGIGCPWAVEMFEAPELARDVLGYKLFCALESLESEKDSIWIAYYKARIDSLLRDIDNFEDDKR